MVKILSIHSFRRGAGKTTFAANMGAILAKRGQRVAVAEANLQSPSLHFFLNRDFYKHPPAYYLNDYLAGRCDILSTVIDVTDSLNLQQGRYFAVLSNPSVSEIARMLREGYNPGLLSEGIIQLAESFELDTLIIDNTAGFFEDNIVMPAIADATLILTRYDSREHQGTIMLIGIARELSASHVAVLVNETPTLLSLDAVKVSLEKAFGWEVVGVIHRTDSLSLSSSNLLALNSPDHPLVKTLTSALDALLTDDE
ncbi:MAG TPA: hypothetical protein PLD47_06660 [Aggregatilineales bacterium]|nr:hypothetical protein [Anaerolineales bacterium]HRE47390.1 hypothetical protein [Aggregatilineales bacterium]